MLLPDGGVYTGEFAADKWEGNGKYEYPDGSCYVGEWKEGKKHGSGIGSIDSCSNLHNTRRKSV